MITSADNKWVKYAASLAEKKFRDESGCFLIEGVRNVTDSLGYLTIEKVLVSEAFASKNSLNYEAETVSNRVFDKISSTQNSQGIVAIARKKEVFSTKSERCLFLDRVRDPGNLGTILRTASACGFGTVYCYSCVDVYNPKVVRSAMSAVCKLDVIDCQENVLGELKADSYCILCADMDGKSVFDSEKPNGKICLVLGNEANGVSGTVKQMSDEIVSLPMDGIESLNVGVCAAVMMYRYRYAK